MTFRPFLSTSQIPSTDNEYSLGSPSYRWADGYFGPNSLHVSSTSAETVTARDWVIGLTADGYLIFSEGGDEKAQLSTDGYVIVSSGIRFSDGSIFTSAQGIQSISPNSITDIELRDSAGLSVIGRSANSTGNPADIVAGTDGHILRLSGTTLGFGQIVASGITDATITNAKLANVATQTIKGRTSSGTGVPEDLTAAQATAILDAFTSVAKGLAPASGGGTTNFLRADGTWATPSGVSLSDGDYGDITLSSSGSVWTVDNDVVSNAKLANMAANTIKGNNTGGSADPSDLTAAQITAMLDAFTSVAQGLTPASGGGTTNFLRADGTWAAPPGGGSMSIGGTVTSGTAGSLLFIGSGPVLAQDNAALYWDISNDRLGIGTTSPGSDLHVRGTGSSTGAWKGRIIAGGDNVAFLMGEYNSQAWLGAHNAALNAWSDFYINPDGSNKLFLGDSGGAPAVPTPIVVIDNNTGWVGVGTSSPTSIFDVASGQVFLPDGSVSSPSIVSRNDTNTGIYFSAADTFNLVSGGSSRLAVASSGITVAGSMSHAVSSITGTTTLDATHYSIFADATSAAFSVNLPAASGCTGRVYSIKKTDSSGNAVTIDPNASELIEGVSTYALSAQYSGVIIQSNGTNWYILAEVA